MNDKGLWWWLLVRRYSYCRCRADDAPPPPIDVYQKSSFLFALYRLVAAACSLRMLKTCSSIAYIHLNRVHRASHAATLQRTTNDHVARSKPVSFRRDVRQKHPSNRLEEVFRIQCINYSNFKYKINIMYLKKYFKSIENRKNKILKVFGNHCETENLAKSVARNGCVLLSYMCIDRWIFVLHSLFAVCFYSCLNLLRWPFNNLYDFGAPFCVCIIINYLAAAAGSLDRQWRRCIICENKVQKQFPIIVIE